MVNYDLEVEPPLKKAGWRCAMRDSGGQCVMTSGGPMMLKWHADSLDSLLMVISCIIMLHSIPSSYVTIYISICLAR